MEKTMGESILDQEQEGVEKRKKRLKKDEEAD